MALNADGVGSASARITGGTTATTAHLDRLLDRLENFASAIATRRPTPTAIADARRRAIRATLALDGAETDLDEIDRLLGADAPGDVALPAPARSTWVDTLQVGAPDVDSRIRTLEIHGAAAGLDADDLAAALRAEPMVALRELHGRLTRGLLAPERAGRVRVSEQAVHDASTGRILYFTTDPGRVGSDLDALCGWLATTDDRAAIVAGTAHLQLLRIHPFDAANGRLARAVSSLLLRDGGLDPHGLAVTDAQLARDPIGYHEQVAGALRRRDLDRWLEYFAESVEAGLLDAARTLAAVFEPPLDRAVAFLDALAEPAFTLADYRDTVDVDVDAARDDLDRLLETGAVRRVRGSAGLRFERRNP